MVGGSWLGRLDILLLGEGREASKVEGEVIVEGEELNRVNQSHFGALQPKCCSDVERVSALSELRLLFQDHVGTQLPMCYPETFI